MVVSLDGGTRGNQPWCARHSCSPHVALLWGTRASSTGPSRLLSSEFLPALLSYRSTPSIPRPIRYGRVRPPSANCSFDIHDTHLIHLVLSTTRPVAPLVADAAVRRGRARKCRWQQVLEQANPACLRAPGLPPTTRRAVQWTAHVSVYLTLIPPTWVWPHGRRQGGAATHMDSGLVVGR